MAVVEVVTLTFWECSCGWRTNQTDKFMAQLEGTAHMKQCTGWTHHPVGKWGCLIYPYVIIPEASWQS